MQNANSRFDLQPVCFAFHCCWPAAASGFTTCARHSMKRSSHASLNSRPHVAQFHSPCLERESVCECGVPRENKNQLCKNLLFLFSRKKKKKIEWMKNNKLPQRQCLTSSFSFQSLTCFDSQPLIWSIACKVCFLICSTHVTSQTSNVTRKRWQTRSNESFGLCVWRLCSKKKKNLFSIFEKKAKLLGRQRAFQQCQANALACLWLFR